MKQQSKDYDYIIAGAGCAGLSLLFRLLKDPVLRKKRVLVVDKSQKKSNDRTWCYWEKGAGLFENVVTHHWNTLAFMTPEFEKQFDLEGYSYKMIKGLDFYSFVLEYTKDFKNVTLVYDSISDIRSENGSSVVQTSNEEYCADYVFNSTGIFNPEINTKNSLLQHFEGWVIKTSESQFDSKIGTLMDFRLKQTHGITFMYVLPTSSTEALVEYTLFSEKVLDKEEYKQELRSYIEDFLHIKDYEITHTEFGIIPMSLAKFKRKPTTHPNIINIGTAGGFTKASSGYTFQFIQKNTKHIVELLRDNKSPNLELSFREKMYDWYDRTLLDVILEKKMEGRDIFAAMFKKLPADKILAFLSNESSLSEDIRIMNSLPMLPFLTSGIKQLR